MVSLIVADPLMRVLGQQNSFMQSLGIPALINEHAPGIQEGNLVTGTAVEDKDTDSHRENNKYI